MPIHHYRIPLAVVGLSLLALPASGQPVIVPEKIAAKAPKNSGKEAAATKVRVGVIPNAVKFDTTQFDVSAGSAVVLEFENKCTMPHNLVILPTAAEAAVVAAVNALGADGFEKGFVPASPEIIAASKLLPSGQTQVLEFVAPTQPGDYLYLCTFPGHWFTMRGVMRVRAKGEKLEGAARENVKEVAVSDALKGSGVTHKPMGEFGKPLVMRTFLPDPGLDEAVFAHHDKSKPGIKYDPDSRKDIYTDTTDPQSGQKVKTPNFVAPLAGVPGAVAVSHGAEFAYAWDTTECRLLYAWRGGFLDMNPYWGKEPGAMREKIYIPRLIGALVYRSSGAAPLAGANAPAPKFGGYRMVNQAPEFYYELGGRQISERVVPQAKGGFEIKVSVTGDGPPLTWKVSEQDKAAVQVKAEGAGVITVSISDRPEPPAKKSAEKPAEKPAAE